MASEGFKTCSPLAVSGGKDYNRWATTFFQKKLINQKKKKKIKIKCKTLFVNETT